MSLFSPKGESGWRYARIHAPKRVRPTLWVLQGWHCRDDVAGMLKAGRERREVGFPARSKDPLARQHSTPGKISYQRGLVLLARVSGQPVIQAPAYLEVPEGLFMGLKLTGVYALLDWACWGGLHPPPTCQQGRAPAFLQSNSQTPRILKHHWCITQIKPK